MYSNAPYMSAYIENDDRASRPILNMTKLVENAVPKIHPPRPFVHGKMIRPISTCNKKTIIRV